jgi:hypothetical protein
MSPSVYGKTYLLTFDHPAHAALECGKRRLRTPFIDGMELEMQRKLESLVNVPVSSRHCIFASDVGLALA